jgi:hypothetical protein
MMTCEQARERLALEPATDDTALADHLASCERCGAYRRKHQTLDGVLRSELRWDPPTALTSQLLALAASPALWVSVARPPERPKEWYVRLVYLLTLAVIGVSIAVAWQVATMLSAQMGLNAVLVELAAAPSRALADITSQLPEARTAIDLIGRARDLAMWLLMVAILWRLGEQYGPLGSNRQRTVNS